MSTTVNASAVVSWPSAPLTASLVHKSLQRLGLSLSLTYEIPESYHLLLQWSAYDALDHELAAANPTNVLISSYTIRKALIRKHFLSQCLLAYTTKHPDSILTEAVPRTWNIDISFADELDEMWTDELWDLGQELECSAKWWILKPGMADRGNDIHIFNSKVALREIFDKFEGDADGEEDAEDAPAIITSHLRHFVIQEYLSSPLLLDPLQVTGSGVHPPASLRGHKFHLRVYCVSSGALAVYLYPRILALFAAVPYSPPNGDRPICMASHLTNTSQQTDRGEAGVRLLDELVGSPILQCPNAVGKDNLTFTAEDVEAIVDQIADILADIFKAAIQSPVHFQPRPNAFELYGFDFLVTHSSDTGSLERPPRFQPKVLEINAEPAIELTGPRLTWILEDLFAAMGKVCVGPFFSKDTPHSSSGWPVGETRFGLRKCFDTGYAYSSI